MVVTIPIPDDLDDILVRELDHAAREAVAVRLYQQGKLSHGQFAKFLGIGIVTMLHTIDPNGVVLGGQMTFGGAESKLGQRFLARVVNGELFQRQAQVANYCDRLQENLGHYYRRTEIEIDTAAREFAYHRTEELEIVMGGSA